MTSFPKYKVGDVVKFNANGTQEGIIKVVNDCWTPYNADIISYNLITEGNKEYHFVREDSITEKIKWVNPDTI